ncbi:MAG: ATP-binding cassette domain-containing protein [Roseovarius sp.]
MRDLAAVVPATRKAGGLMPLEVQGLRRVLGGKPVLDGLDLTLEGTGCSVIMGPNGAGKSLFLKLVHGLEAPDAGRIAWNGQAPDRIRHRQAMVFQKPVLLRRSVAANVEFVLKARGGDRKLVQPLLEEVGLADKARQPARRLSGGEAQRLALGRALATRPDVLLMDEPTASLDPASVLAIERIVLRVLEQGVKVLLVTHDAGQARRLADEVVFIHRGHVAEHSPADSFFPEPHSKAARDFLAGRILV